MSRFQLGQGLEDLGVARSIHQVVVDLAGQAMVAGVDRTAGGSTGPGAVMRCDEVAGDGDQPGHRRPAFVAESIGAPVGPEVGLGDHVVDVGFGHPNRDVAPEKGFGFEIEAVEGRVVSVGGTRQQLRMISDFASLVHHRRCFTIPNRFYWLSIYRGSYRGTYRSVVHSELMGRPNDDRQSYLPPQFRAKVFVGDPRNHGDDPDYRFTLANERTFLAWIRTALALAAGGLGAVTILDDFPGEEVLGLGLLLLSFLTAATSYRRWAIIEKAMRLSQPLPPSKLPLLMGIGVGLVSVVAAILFAFGGGTGG